MKVISSLSFLPLEYTKVFLHFIFQIVNGYFVHFFAPTSLPKLPKNVVFIIDISGSMSGREIEQVSYYITIKSQWNSLCCDGRDMVAYGAYVLLKLYHMVSCCDLSNAQYHKYESEASL